MLIGLASKKRHLIVEFANQLRDEGLSLTQAAVQASQERLRPILMTAISTLLGIYPLMVATGGRLGQSPIVGHGYLWRPCWWRRAHGLFVVPVLYIAIGNVQQRRDQGVPIEQAQGL